MALNVESVDLFLDDDIMENKLQATIGKYWGFHCPRCESVILIAPDSDGKLERSGEQISTVCSQCQLPISFVIHDQKVVLT